MYLIKTFSLCCLSPAPYMISNTRSHPLNVANCGCDGNVFSKHCKQIHLNMLNVGVGVLAHMDCVQIEIKRLFSIVITIV